MTDPSTSAAGAITDRKSGIRRIVAQLAHAFEHQLSPGDLAALRRIEPADPAEPAFWNAVGRWLEPAGTLPPPESPGRDAAETRWAVVLGAMAWLKGLHRPGRRLGSALASAGLSELRLTRLLRASGASLPDLLRAATHQLVSRAEPVDVEDLAWLVLTADTPRGERTRRRVARDFYAHLHSKPKQDGEGA